MTGLSGLNRRRKHKFNNTQTMVDLTQSLGRWLKLLDSILRLKSKHVLTARCLMLLIGLLFKGEDGPGGTPSPEALSVSS